MKFGEKLPFDMQKESSNSLWTGEHTWGGCQCREGAWSWREVYMLWCWLGYNQNLRPQSWARSVLCTDLNHHPLCKTGNENNLPAWPSVVGNRKWSTPSTHQLPGTKESLNCQISHAEAVTAQMFTYCFPSIISLSPKVRGQVLPRKGFHS